MKGGSFILVIGNFMKPLLNQQKKEKSCVHEILPKIKKIWT